MSTWRKLSAWLSAEWAEVLLLDFKYEPTFIEKKKQKKQIKKPSSNLQILPKLTPMCCRILH